VRRLAAPAAAGPAGGRRPAAPVRGYYYEPTVLAGGCATVLDEEVFGPVVTVVPYATETDAVDIVNSWGCGLAGSVWTTDPHRGLGIARRVRTGTFGVNLYVPELGAPWGSRATGHGGSYGPEGLESYRQSRSVLIPGPAAN